MAAKDDEARRLRLRTLRVRAKFKSARAASEELGFSESTYRSHENGTRPITEASAVIYAQTFGVPYEWLWSGIGPGPDEIPRNRESNPLPNAGTPFIPKENSASVLPIRGRAQGGDGGAIVLDGSVMDHLPGPSNLSAESGAYGIEVIGDSMVRRYMPGEIVWVNPVRAVHKGDCAVFHVRQPGGELHAYVKEYLRHSGDNVVVCQYNPEAEISFDRDMVEAIHLIVGTGTR